MTKKKTKWQTLLAGVRFLFKKGNRVFTLVVLFMGLVFFVGIKIDSKYFSCSTTPPKVFKEDKK